MRTFCAIGAALLMACAAPAASRADGPGPEAARAAKPDCRCPDLRKRVARTHRPHARYRQLPYPAAAPGGFVPVYYNPALPSPYDSAYDRAMVLHFRSPPVSGFYRPEPGYPATPPVPGIHYYRVQAGPVFQYDGVTGEYIQLARSDPASLAAMAPPLPPPAPAWRGERG